MHGFSVGDRVQVAVSVTQEREREKESVGAVRTRDKGRRSKPKDPVCTGCPKPLSELWVMQQDKLCPARPPRLLPQFRPPNGMGGKASTQHSREVRKGLDLSEGSTVC